MKKRLFIILIILVIFSISLYFLFPTKPSENNFKAPGNDYNSPKKVESYFVDTLKMTPQEAKKFADIGVSFYVTKDTSLDGIIGNLAYYGLVKDEKALRYALENTKDTVPGKEGSIKVGNNRTIDLAYYGLSRNMDTWQIADILLNNPHPIGTQYNYVFMPGDPNARYGERPQGK
ncbi:MAG: hypothetical protein Q8P10_03240 [bacterium]|nr:hypothetical protein [bacterium]